MNALNRSPELSRLLIGGQPMVKAGAEPLLAFTSPKQPGGHFLLPQVARLEEAQPHLTSPPGWLDGGSSP